MWSCGEEGKMELTRGIFKLKCSIDSWNLSLGLRRKMKLKFGYWPEYRKYMSYFWESCPQKAGLRPNQGDCLHLPFSLLLSLIFSWHLIICVLPMLDFGLVSQKMSTKFSYPGYLVCHLESSIQLSSDLCCLLIWIVQLHKNINIKTFNLSHKNQQTDNFTFYTPSLCSLEHISLKVKILVMTNRVWIKSQVKFF